MNDLLPDLSTALPVATLALLWGAASAAFVARLRLRHGIRAPYTRKIFHFLIISVAALVQLRWQLPGAVVYGSIIAALVLYAVLRGSGSGFYEALARDTDAPHRSLFILVPLATTAAGGLLASLLFPAAAHIGYVAVAVGDALGEPVGTRWGRHRYRVRSVSRSVLATRSLEGSAAVLGGTFIAVAAVLLLTGHPAPSALGTALAVAAATAVVEAVSHHGLDNLTIQLAAAGVASLLI